ncbi:MAG: HAMP domain-containing histidine kinase [Pirellulaceae bacterium]|nr:HAMP domain-containing histidine kinase [Pirellulaceae bacterium]
MFLIYPASLPPIGEEETLWSPPLPYTTSCQLYLLFSEPVDQDKSIARWQELLRNDPFFALWTLWHTQQSLTTSGEATISHLATTLSKNGLKWLVWPNKERANDATASEKGRENGRLRATSEQLVGYWKGTNSAVLPIEDSQKSNRRDDLLPLSIFLHSANQGLDIPEKLITTFVKFIGDDPGSVVTTDSSTPSEEDKKRADLFCFGEQSDATLAWRKELLPEFDLKALLVARRKEALLETTFQEELQRQKLLSMYQLAYGASHEVNNPLANISSRAQYLLFDEEDEGKRKRLEMIVRQVERAHEMIRQLMWFAKPPTPAPQPLLLEETITEIVDHFQIEAEQKELTIKVIDLLPAKKAGAVPSSVWADADQFQAALLALLKNSAEAVKRGTTIHIEVKAGSHQPPDDLLQEGIWLSVVDDGIGLDEKERQHAFDPFYSGREAGRGLGFGLSWCWRILELHGGTVLLKSEKRKGTTVSLFWPNKKTT